MGIHNSSSLSLEQRVANPKKKNIKNNMKAFTTACALIGASASADSQFYTAPRLHGAGVIPQTVVASLRTLYCCHHSLHYRGRGFSCPNCRIRRTHCCCHQASHCHSHPLGPYCDRSGSPNHSC